MNLSKALRGSLLPLTIIAVAGLAYYLYYNTYFGLDLTARVQNRAEDVVQSAYFMCQVTERLLQKRADGLIEGIEGVMAMLGEPALGPGRQNWEVRSLVDGQIRGVGLPPLKIYQQATERRDLEGLAHALLRRIQGEITILQCLNDRGDQVKVYCTLSKIFGPEQTTDLIPIQMPGGQPDVSNAALQRGDIVVRPEYVQDRLYLSIYRPLREGRKTIGVLVLRVIDSDLDRLRDNLQHLQLGQTGYVFALKATGAQRGHYVISRGGERDGEDIWESTDAAGRPFIQSIIAQALNLDPRKKRISVPIVFERYPWKNPGDNHARYKTAAVTYFEPWDWAIGAGYYEDEL